MVDIENFSGKVRILLFCLVVVSASIGSTGCQNRAAENPNNSGSADTAVATAKIEESDRLYEAREDMTKARVAVLALRQAVTADSNNFDAAWKLARASFFVGDNTTEGSEASEMFKTGIEAGKAATKLQPEKPEGHFWLGANHGGEAARATIPSPNSVNNIRTAMETVLKLDEKFQGGSAYLGLGRLYLEAPKMLGGSTAKAIENLKKGLAISPNNALMKYYLAEAYEAENRDAEARKELEEVLKSTADPKFVAEHKAALKKANKLMEKIANK